MIRKRGISSPRRSMEGQDRMQLLFSNQSKLAMLDDEAGPTCLSGLYHGPGSVRDKLQHYLGCIEINQREGFLDLKRNKILDPDTGKNFWETQIDIELNKIKAEKGIVDEKDVTAEMHRKAGEQVEKIINSLAVSIEAQYKRTQVLRMALSQPKAHAPKVNQSISDQAPVSGPVSATTVVAGASDPTHPLTPAVSNLVAHVDTSRRAWRVSQEYRDGIKKVRSWRKSMGRHTTKPEDVAKIEEELECGRGDVQKIVSTLRTSRSVDEIADYDLMRDVNAYLIQYTRMPERNGGAMEGATGDYSCTGDPKMRHLPLRPVDEDLTDDWFKGKFPDQRVSVSLLLGSAHNEPCVKEKNILSKDACDGKDPTRLRYIHIPANNMEWVEHVIAGYYGDKIPALSPNHLEPSVKTKTQLLLRPEFWRGQQHGARSGIVHARYMRPLCERVSSAVDKIDDNPSDIVLFMPYLHWETDRMRNAISKMIDAESEKQRHKQMEASRERKKQRIKEREGVGSNGKVLTHPAVKDPLGHSGEVEGSARTGHMRPLRSLTDVIPRFAPKKKGGIEIRDGRLMVKSTLGQYLIDTARLYEAMSTFRDQQMLEHYLYRNPPLHPRRTLDQSHYWTLKTTKARDRDQVVYRGTNVNVENTHRLEEVINPPSTAKEALSASLKSLKRGLCQLDDTSISADGDNSAEPSGNHDEPASSGWRFWKGKTKTAGPLQWSGHSDETDRDGCEHCASDIKKVSKLIMVDQLWMWILDDQTVITFFPRRYGYNKYDPHGIHRSIRNRLRIARKNQIRSVYDLALIILDECSNTFFDRTKTHDSQPQVMDIFSEAIGNVTNKHTISFRHVWHWAENASKVYRAKSKHLDEASELHVPLLNISPEGELQREVKDILDELDIMIAITRRQNEVIRRFGKHVESILDPAGRWRNGSDGKPVAHIDDDDDSDAENELGPHARAGPADGEETEEQRNEREAREKQRKQEKEAARKRDRKRRKTQLDWFHMLSQDLLCEVADRIDELEGLRDGARSTAQSVNDLLQLKQQQASVVQAWESVKQAEEAVRQGRAIMMFTIVTIVFLPLSFMSSVFGMNNVDFGQDNTTWTVGEQLRLMFPISIGIIVVSLVIAFYSFLRASIWSLYTYIATWLAVHTGLYGIWLDYSDEWKSTKLMRKTEEEVIMLKEIVRSARRRKRAERHRDRQKDEAEKANNAQAADSKKSWWRRPGKLWPGDEEKGSGKGAVRSEPKVEKFALRSQDEQSNGQATHAETELEGGGGAKGR